MAITFPDEIHPKFKKRMRFDYSPRAIQYLNFFGITSYEPYKYFPLDLTFDSHKHLEQFLYELGIVYDEVNMNTTVNTVIETYTIVDTKLIYENNVDITTKLLHFKYYTINEVANMLSFSRPTLYKLIKDGELKAIRIYKQFRIKHTDLVKYINESK